LGNSRCIGLSLERNIFVINTVILCTKQPTGEAVAVMPQQQISFGNVITNNAITQSQLKYPLLKNDIEKQNQINKR
jgi:hypothetical protein